MAKVSQFLTVICLQQDNDGVLSCYAIIILCHMIVAGYYVIKFKC